MSVAEARTRGEPGGSLTLEEVERYRSRGYLEPRQLLSETEAARYRADCERCCGTELMLRDRTAERPKRQASNRVKPYLLYPWAAELVRHRRILDAVESLIGPDILLFHTTVWLKDPGSENFVPWHQDATYFGLSPYEHVTAWVALTPSTPEMGCVQILPGSHREGQRPHRDNKDGRLMLSRGQTMVEPIDDSRAVDLVLRPGEVTLHHTLAFHRSGPNRSAERRIGFGISYIPTRVRHVGPTRLAGTLVRGVDRYGHFDREPTPTEELDTAAIAAHADSLGRYWQASEGIPEMALVH
jgi:ectoine hydroxylase-related dioxygenase (phytanoyl-CoA dioxygenase family)